MYNVLIYMLCNFVVVLFPFVQRTQNNLKIFFAVKMFTVTLDEYQHAQCSDSQAYECNRDSAQLSMRSM